MNITSDAVFGVFFAGSAVTAAMVLTAEALTARAERRRAELPTVVISVVIPVETERERADV
ncbi:hypothetical protein [Kitasatospora cineracea]|uniref:hypothetical protein n=1 Tax=Kitasatospora cineracea TaxID=88074 RepID=UPI0037B40290